MMKLVSYGLGDRYFWAWGLIVWKRNFRVVPTVLSRLWVSGLWPYDSTEECFIRRIQSLFAGARFLTRKVVVLKKLSNEGSYCVTALVAFDLLVTIDLLSEKITNLQKIN